MKTVEIINDLGLVLSNGECIELIKKERDNLKELVGDMKKKDVPFKKVQDNLRLLIAYNTLIESFEGYLNHEG